MRLGWNEIRARAASFAEEWKNAHHELGESQTFYNGLFEVFGVTRRRVASFEEPVKRLGKERGLSIFSRRVCFWLNRRALAGIWPAPNSRRSITFLASRSRSFPVTSS
jgi:hypothetical protein